MEKKPVSTRTVVILIVIFMSISVACSVFSTTDNVDEEAQRLEETMLAQQVQLTVDALNAVNPTSTPERGKPIMLGKEYESIEGGFTLQGIPDYLIEELEASFVVMTAEDSDPDFGPLIMAYTSDCDANLTIHQSLETVTEELTGDSDLEITGKHEINVDGKTGLAVEMNGELDGELVGGRINLVKIEPSRQFVFIGLAPDNRWGELDPLVDAVLKSVTFKKPPVPEKPASDTKDNIQPTEIKLGKEYKFAQGGFSFKRISGYIVEERDEGLLTMTAKDGDPECGPLLILFIKQFDSNTSLNKGFKDITDYYSNGFDFEFSEKEKIIAGGKNGLTADVTGEIDGEEITGRISFVEISSTRQFVLFGFSPKNRWLELAPFIDAVLDSVTILKEPAVKPLCGNGVCGEFENPGNCPQDCGYVEEPLCGNGVCGDYENPGNCPQDCY